MENTVGDRYRTISGTDIFSNGHRMFIDDERETFMVTAILGEFYFGDGVKRIGSTVRHSRDKLPINLMWILDGDDSIKDIFSTSDGIAAILSMDCDAINTMVDDILKNELLENKVMSESNTVYRKIVVDKLYGFNVVYYSFKFVFNKLLRNIEGESADDAKLLIMAIENSFFK